ncbi:MAG: GNAT family N-acetyltransferase [Bacteroides sp.]|nr:GNAT family N-acetyltransferase [Bacteroides sp.]
MEDIIEPISKELLKSELTEDKHLRMTNKSNNQIYIVTYQDSPHVMKEVGRLREITFRDAGGGTGMSMDIDEYDIMDNPYKQLIVWNPEAEEILGGYRYIRGTDVEFDKYGHPKLATAHMFNFSEKFIKEYLPTTIELGRSFVTVEYQSSRSGSKGLFVLDNLWDGLGALTVIMPEVKYFFGKVTMYPSYHREGRDMILYFLKKYFEDRDGLITPVHSIRIEASEEKLAKLFDRPTFKENYRILNSEIRRLGYNIPPLVNAYMSLSPTMRMFGTAINYGFGNVEETGILIAVNEILEDKRIRHIESFIKNDLEDSGITAGVHKFFFSSGIPE